MTIKDADWAFAAYETARDRLPKARFPSTCEQADSLADIADSYDVFLLDAFGVLNIGDTAIPGARARIEALQAAGKQVLVVTNAASLTAAASLEKFQALGFEFSLEQVVSSRDALTRALTSRGEANWGVMGSEASRVDRLGVSATLLKDDRQVYDSVDGFVLLSSAGWNTARQQLLLESLGRNARPVLVGNPDIVAPRETHLSLEPGFFAHQIADATGITPEFYGKPFANIFDMALMRLPQSIPKHRILMVGDTLHTDVLGGAAAGIKTAMITSFGLFAKSDSMAAIQASGIVPDHVLTRT